MISPPLPHDSWSVDLGGVHVEFGAGLLDRLGEAARRLGSRRALVVTDPGLVEAGIAERAAAVLSREDLVVATFDGVDENPTTANVADGVEAARAHGADLLVAVGGGSSMDCAKGVNFLVTNGGRMEDYWGDGKASKPLLASIGVPTTAGTGSEAQRFTLISQAETHAKMACGDVKARFRTVLLDPDLLASVPSGVAALAGLDALTHAVESYVTRRRNPVSQLFAREAWQLLEGSFQTFLRDRADAGARERMLLGSHLAGAAIEASMLGVAHSCANPLTAHYGVTHGAAVGLLLPHVIRFNGPEVDALYGELASLASSNGHRGSGAEQLSAHVADLYATTGLDARLRDWGVDESRLDVLAEEAAAQWTAQFNPRPAAASDLRDLYTLAY